MDRVKNIFSKIKEIPSELNKYLSLIIVSISIIGGLEQFVSLYLLSPDLLMFYSASQIVITGVYYTLITFSISSIFWIGFKLIGDEFFNTFFIPLFIFLIIATPFIDKKFFDRDYNNSEVNLKNFGINEKLEKFNLVYYNDKYAFYKKDSTKDNEKPFIVKDINDVLYDYNVIYYNNEREQRDEKLEKLKSTHTENAKILDSMFIDKLNDIKKAIHKE